MDNTVTDLLPISDIGNTTSILTSDSRPIDTSMDYWTILRYLSIILILAFLGFNLFTFFGDITNDVTKILGPTFAGVGKLLGNITKQTTNVTADGAKEAVDIAAGSVNSGINLLEKGLDDKNLQHNISQNNINSALSDAVTKQNEPIGDDSISTTQLRTTGKGGYCYIGEDRNIRTCMQVGVGDHCMSGDIFPTRDTCVNPSLRA